MKKKIDCIKIKRMGTNHIHNMVKDMSLEQELQFWQEKTKKLLQKKKENATVHAQ